MEYIVGGLIVVLVIWLIMSYNNIVSLKESGINSEKDISIQLDRRGKVFDSLIATVKKAMDYEKSTLKEVIDLRSKIIAIDGEALDSKEKQQLEEKMSQLVASGSVNSGISMTMEAYPELKANDTMLKMQEEIVTTENKLSYAKQGYNAAVEKYNATVKSFPGNFIVGKFKELIHNFKYWELEEEDIKDKEERVIQF